MYMFDYDLTTIHSDVHSWVKYCRTGRKATINHHRPASLIILVGRGLRYFTGRKLWLHFLFGLLWRGLIICPLSVCAKIKNVRANICNVCSLCPIFRSFTEFLWSSLDYAESKGLFFVCFKLFFGEFFTNIRRKHYHHWSVATGDRTPIFAIQSECSANRATAVVAKYLQFLKFI